MIQIVYELRWAQVMNVVTMAVAIRIQMQQVTFVGTDGMWTVSAIHALNKLVNAAHVNIQVFVLDSLDVIGFGVFWVLNER